ncbi:MAG: 50S ribosomal protein L1 [Patescibacteria group bacterium]
MAKKADLLARAKEMGLDVSVKNTIAQIEEAIASAGTKAAPADEQTAPAEVEATGETFAKSGKRSKKALEEAEADAEKEARKDNEAEEPVKKKNPAPKTRPLIERRSKKYRDAHKKIDKSKVYPVSEAVDLAVQTSTTTFDSSVELHVRLDVDPRQADQNIRETLVLPAGTGKDVRVAVFGEDDDVKKARDAGADVAGNDDFLQQLDKEDINFDVLIASPKVMARLSKYARILGPKGLMPSPKSGTVNADVAKAVSEAKAGKVEYRVDEAGIIHLSVGKVSFGAEKIGQNLDAVITSIKNNKPSSVKGNFVISAYLTTSMGPSIKIAL